MLSAENANTNSADPDQIESDRIFSVCYSGKQFVNSSRVNQHLIRKQKEKGANM